LHHNIQLHRCATNRYFQVIGSIHDIESYIGVDNTSSLNEHLFTSHWSHLAIVLIWLSSIFLHIGMCGTYPQWLYNPIACVQLSHGLWDPHLYTHSLTSDSNNHDIARMSDINIGVVLSYSGVYNTLYTLGFNTVTQIYSIVLTLDLMSVGTLLVGYVHSNLPSWASTRSTSRHLYNPKCMSVTSHITSPSMHISSQSITLLSLAQLLWSTHLIDTQGVTLTKSHPLSFVGGLKSDTSCIMLSDISHHHLALPILLLSLIYHTNSIPSKGIIRASTHGPYSSLALSLSPSTHSIRSNIVSQHIYSLPSFSVLSYDFITSSTTYLHHSWISGITILASSSHLSIYLIRDHLKDAISTIHISSILTDKSSFLSTISYVSIYLGCHTLGVYIHNDTCTSLTYLTYTLSLDPTLCVGVQDLLGKHLSNTSNTLTSMSTFNKSLSSFIFTIGPGDLYTHHSIAVGLHVTTLIVLKGCLDSKQSHHYPDKTQQHYAFSCDGPSRGGTCDVSSWDSFYLATFWTLNTLAWSTFYYHWKHLTLYIASPSLFDSASVYLNGWFRDYLWSNSSSLIHGYNTSGANDLSTWSWLFLGAHLLFATSFMFLIS
jgi:photosystem I P700 chlorophyll a apoprotein A2